MSEVSALANVAPATARRSLLTLQALGYGRNYGRNYGRRFVLTPRVLRLSAPFLSSMNFQEVAIQYLQDLVDLNRRWRLCRRARWQRSCLYRFRAVQAFRPPYCRNWNALPRLRDITRALLAHLPSEKLDDYFTNATFEKLTEKTITDPGKLRAVLTEIRQVGFASIQDELDYGVVSVSVPIFADDRAG